ncbi:transposase, partial [mine drainage metagenome]
MKNQVLTPAVEIGAAHESSWRGEREAVYQRLALTPVQQRTVEELVRLSPARKVGKGALHNLRGRLPSKKCSALRLFESHTVERLFFYEVELDPRVIGYVTQVPLVGVERRLPNGRRHVSTPTLDVLVFTQKSITIVECKDEDWLRKREGTKGWSCLDGVWTCEPYARWATDRGLGFRVWHPPYPFAVYLRNMELIYARLGESQE